MAIYTQVHYQSRLLLNYKYRFKEISTRKPLYGKHAMYIFFFFIVLWFNVVVQSAFNKIIKVKGQVYIG